MNFYESYYREYRADLVRFALRFDRSVDTAEDLFEDCHIAICGKYKDLEAKDYQRIIKTAMKNRFLNLKKRPKLTEINSSQEFPMPVLQDMVIQKEDIRKIQGILLRMSQTDQDILLGRCMDPRKYYKAKRKLMNFLENYYHQT